MTHWRDREEHGPLINGVLDPLAVQIDRQFVAVPRTSSSLWDIYDTTTNTLDGGMWVGELLECAVRVMETKWSDR